MRPTVIDRVAWSSCLSVCHVSSEACKTAQPFDIPFELKMAIVLRPQICDVTSPYVLDVGADRPKRMGISLGGRTCPCMPDDNLP